MIDKYKTYTGFITELEPNQIFVFGSNTQGRHGKGAAKWAKDHAGAIYGQARGLQGQSYAIITKDLTEQTHPSIIASLIMAQIGELYDFAKANTQLEFIVAYKGLSLNLNGYTSKQMASFFSAGMLNGHYWIPFNMVFEEDFSKMINYGNPANE